MFINSSWVKCRLHSSFIPISWMMHVYEPNRAYGWLPRILANSNKLFTRTTFSVLKTTNSISIMSFSNETNRTSRYSYMHFTWNSVHSMQHLNYLSFHGQFKRQTCCSPTSFSRNIMVLTQRIMNEFPPFNWRTTYIFFCYFSKFCCLCSSHANTCCFEIQNLDRTGFWWKEIRGEKNPPKWAYVAHESSIRMIMSDFTALIVFYLHCARSFRAEANNWLVACVCSCGWIIHLTLPTWLNSAYLSISVMPL